MSKRSGLSVTVSANRRRASATLLALLLVASLVCVGCAAKNPHPAGSYERGLFFAEQGKDLQAIGAFESFVRQSPLDSLAAEAQYRKAKTYMEMREYPLASVEFQIMRKDYPTDPLVEDALFEEGKAYLLQVDRVERDLTGAYEARLHFLTFSQTYPGSKYMPEVVAYMQEISDLMVRKRLEQVKVYGQLKRYAAIALVLDNVMIEEAGSSLIPEAMWRRAKVAMRLDDPDTAAEMYEKLIDLGKENKFHARAVAALRALDAEDAAFKDDEDY